VPVRPLDCKTDNLSQRVNAGIGSSGPDYTDRMTGKPGQSIFQLSLNGIIAPLLLKPPISRAVILDGGPETPGQAFGGIFRRWRAHNDFRAVRIHSFC
jgi:hypothetical protein